MSVNEQDNPIGKHRRQLREACVALRGGDVRGHAAAGERLEAQQQPHRIVRDVEYEGTVWGKVESDLGPFRFMADGRSRHREYENRGRERQSA